MYEFRRFVKLVGRHSSGREYGSWKKWAPKEKIRWCCRRVRVVANNNIRTRFKSDGRKPRKITLLLEKFGNGKKSTIFRALFAPFQAEKRPRNSVSKIFKTFHEEETLEIMAVGIERMTKNLEKSRWRWDWKVNKSEYFSLLVPQIYRANEKRSFVLCPELQKLCPSHSLLAKLAGFTNNAILKTTYLT